MARTDIYFPKDLRISKCSGLLVRLFMNSEREVGHDGLVSWYFKMRIIHIYPAMGPLRVFLVRLVIFCFCCSIPRDLHLNSSRLWVDGLKILHIYSLISHTPPPNN